MNDDQILFLNPNRMKPVVAPLAIDYLAQGLEKAGFGVDILDFAFNDDSEGLIEDYFSSNSPLAIGVTVRNTDDCYYVSQDFVLREVKAITDEIKKHSHAPIIFGGVGFSGMPEAVMRYIDVNMGIVGEGEKSLPKLLQCFRTDGDLSTIPGLIYKTPSGYRRNPVEYLDLSHLSLSSRGAIDNLRYFNEGGMAGFETKRGCDQKCIYCLDPISKGRQIRMRQPKDVADEIECLLNLGITHFHTCDSEFNLPEQHAIAVCEELIRRKLGDKICWYAYCSPVPFSDSLANLMKQAGCVGIDFGVDHGNDEMLSRLKRPFKSGDVENTARICHRHNIVFMFDLLLGGPGETKATIRETIDLMRKVLPSRVGIAYGVRIYPGTRMAEIVRAEGLTTENPNLRGRIEDNENFLEPIFYLSAAMGCQPEAYLARLVEDDAMFFFASPEETGQNYNYNENSMLIQAIKSGYRGAFWDILRRIAG